MKLIIITSLIAIITAHNIHSQDNFYSIDAAHSILTFKASHVGFGAVIGQFEAYEGTIYYNSPSEISASVSLYVESLSTNNEGRDGILKEKFFQYENHPTIKFISSSVNTDDGKMELIGKLTMGGKTKEIIIPFKLISKPSDDQFGHNRIALSGGLTIDRKEFGLIYRGNSFWDGIVSDEIEIDVEVSAYRYNSIETIFPFRENSIGKILFERYKEGGAKAVSKFFNEDFNDESINTSHASNLRGALHTAQSGNLEGAVDILKISMNRRQDLTDIIKAEYLAQMAKYYFLNKSYQKSLNTVNEALALDANNTLALELNKHL